MIKANYDSTVVSLLSQIESHKNRLQSLELDDRGSGETRVQDASSLDFAKLTMDALDSVHESQETSKVIREAYERGDDIPLTDVVMQMQKFLQKTNLINKVETWPAP